MNEDRIANASQGYPNRYYRVAWVLGGVAALLSLGAGVSWSCGRSDAATVSLFFAGLIAAVALAFSLGGAAIEGALQSFRDGDVLGRWTVGCSQWQAHMRPKHERAVRQLRVLVVLLVVLVGVLVHFESIPLGWLFPGLALVVLNGLLGRLAIPGSDASPEGAEVVVGPTMAYINGRRVMWGGVATGLRSVALDTERRLLLVGGRLGGGQDPYVHEFPYPQDAEDEVCHVMWMLAQIHGLDPVNDA